MGSMDGRQPKVDRETLVARAWGFVIRGVLIALMVAAITYIALF